MLVRGCFQRSRQLQNWKLGGGGGGGGGGGASGVTKLRKQ